MSSKYVDEGDLAGSDAEESAGRKTSEPDAAGGKAKDDGDDDMPALVEHDPWKPKPPNLVQRFVEFAFSMLHTKMDSFFERHAEQFDQEWDDYLQAGETLEQYDVFKEYEQLLDENLTEFVKKEGFGSVGACFREISSLVEKDKADKEEEMRKIQERLREAQEALRRKQDALEGKTAGEKEGDAPAQSSNPPPLQFFYQPITLEQLINMVLNMAEYQTFSFMMRMKVQQMKMMKRLKEQMKQLQAEKEKRDATAIEDAPTGGRGGTVEGKEMDTGQEEDDYATDEAQNGRHK
jgi:hypothetical protein